MSRNLSQPMLTLTDYDGHLDEAETEEGLHAVRIVLSGDIAFIYSGRLKLERGHEQFDWDEDETGNGSVGVDARALMRGLAVLAEREVEGYSEGWPAPKSEPYRPDEYAPDPHVETGPHFRSGGEDGEIIMLTDEQAERISQIVGGRRDERPA